MYRTLASIATAVALASCATAGEQTFAEANSGTYELEKTHAFITWRISHNGLSKYTARFTDFDATIQFDPDNPVASSVSASINPLSVETDHPTKRESWNNQIATDGKFLNGEEFPAITFESTSVEQTGEFTGIITGNLTLLGISKEVEMTALLPAIGDEIEVIIEAEFLEQ